MNLIRSIINFFGFNDAIVDGIGERGMRDSSIIRYNEVHDMYDKIIKDLGDMSAYVSKGYIYDKIKERTGLSRILNHTKKRDLRFIDILPSLKQMGFLDTNARNPDITIAGITLALQFGNALPKYITGRKNITVVDRLAFWTTPCAISQRQVFINKPAFTSL